jgi:hypothetical protein
MRIRPGSRTRVAGVVERADESAGGDPHLGDRSKLIYPIGALLQRIGRGKAVDNMLTSSLTALPNDPNVATAKAKLRP